MLHNYRRCGICIKPGVTEHVQQMLLIILPTWCQQVKDFSTAFSVLSEKGELH